MEEDTEVLDWEHSEEVNHAASRRASYDHGGRHGDSSNEDDDIEDAVSLGDEEDQASYYHSGGVTVNNRGPYAMQDLPERPASAQRHVDTLGANEQRRSQDMFHDRERSTGFANQSSNASPESPPGRRSSKNQSSPQLMQANNTRLTHALPAKPVMANAGLLTSSQSSIAQATRMTSMSPRTAAREAKKLPPTPATSATPELSIGRELGRSRDSDQQHYYSRDTNESQRTFPVSNLPSNSAHGTSQSRHRRGSTGGRRVSPSNSDPHHSQTSRLNRHSSRVQPDNGSREAIRSRTPDPDNLSYKDRHYRPLEATSVDVEERTVERSEVISVRITSKSRYDRSPLKSPTRPRRAGSHSPPGITRPPPQQHERERDYSFLPSNPRPARGRNSYTNADSAIQRGQEVPQPQSGHAGRNWVAPHISPDFSRSELDTRRPRYRVPDEDVRLIDAPPADNRNRPAPRRRANSRDARRDREPTRHTDMREQLNCQSSASAPRTRSPPPRERDQGRDHAGYQDSISAPLPNRMERSSRLDHSLSSNGPPPQNLGVSSREAPENRPLDYDSRPAPSYDQRHRGSEREYDRPRRDFPEVMEQPRRTDGYPPDARPLDRSRRYLEELDRLTLPDGSQSSQMKRRPLPPQTHTYMTSSATGPIYRDPPPHSIAPPPSRDAHRRGRIPDDSNAPRRPRRASNSPPRTENHGGISRQLDAGRNNDPPHPQVAPRIDAQMDVDPLERSNYLPSANNPRASRLQADERVEVPDGPRSSRPHPLPKRVLPTLPKSNHPDFPQGPNNSEYTNFGPQARSFHPSPVHSTTRYDQKRPDDGYQTRDQGQFERWPAMPHGDRPPPRNVRTRPEVLGQPPVPVHISGSNNIPIGVRRGPGQPSGLPLPSPSDGSLNPPHMEFDFGAKPPPSTLINPAKAHLPGKETYERPRGMPIPDDLPRRVSLSESQPPRRRSPPPHQVPSLPPKPQSLPSLPVTELEKQRRMDRKSRFDQPAPLSQGGNHVPEHLDDASDNDTSQRHATPPPSREPSMMSSSARHSDLGHNLDDTSRNGMQEPSDIVTAALSNSQRRQEAPPAASAPQESGRFSPELLMNPASLRRIGSRLGDYDKPRYASTLGPYQYFLDDEPQPSLSRRLSLEKPPRLRKYQSENLNGGERVEPQGQTSPHGSGGREPQDDRSIHIMGRVERAPPPSQRQGEKISLLERLSSVEDLRNGNNGGEQSLRDRLVPSKRDRDDMMRDDGGGREPSYDGEDGNDNKRAKRRNGKGRRGGRK